MKLKLKLLTAGSIAVVLAAGAAMAQTSQSGTASSGTTMNSTRTVTTDTTVTDSTGAPARQDMVNYTLFGSGSAAQGVKVSINSQATAKGMLDQPVRNASGERVGTLKDIIINSTGEAALAIVSDAKFIDIGAKDAAFDYNLIMRRNEDGDIIMPLTEAMIDNAREFSYDVADDTPDENVRVMPANGYSVRELIDADVIDNDGDNVADVQNIAFRNGRADSVIVEFDKVLGLGGDRAALAFADVQIVKEDKDDEDDHDLDLRLTAAQTANFEAFKQRASN